MIPPDLAAKVAALMAAAEKERAIRDRITAKLADAPLLTVRPEFDGKTIIGVDFTKPEDGENIAVSAPAVAMLASAIVARGTELIQVWRGIYDGRYTIDIETTAPGHG